MLVMVAVVVRLVLVKVRFCGGLVLPTFVLKESEPGVRVSPLRLPVPVRVTD